MFGTVSTSQIVIRVYQLEGRAHACNYSAYSDRAWGTYSMVSPNPRPGLYLQKAQGSSWGCRSRRAWILGGDADKRLHRPSYDVASLAFGPRLFSSPCCRLHNYALAVLLRRDVVLGRQSRCDSVHAHVVMELELSYSGMPS